jgi:hypothetical protein
MYNKKQETGGSCTTSPGDKIKGSRQHKAGGPKRLDSMGGSAHRGSGNKKG